MALGEETLGRIGWPGPLRAGIVLDRDLAGLFHLLDDEEAAVPFDDASGVGVLMTRDDQEAPGTGANALVVRNGRLYQLRALFHAALADEPQSLLLLIPLGELCADPFDPLVHLAEESLVPGTPILHGPQAPFFHGPSGGEFCVFLPLLRGRSRQ